MKNKNGKANIWVIVIIALALIAGVYYFSTTQTTLAQHSVPADISKTQSSGNGVAVSFYNCPANIANQSVITQDQLAQCTKVNTPSNFVVSGSIVSADASGFSIVKRSSPISCSTTANCYTSYNTNATASPNLQCYQSQCVLAQINAVNLGIGVTNPSASQVTYNLVGPTSISPQVWNTSIGAITAQTLAPGQTYSWFGALGTSQFEGTTQTFSATVSGTNSYTLAISTASDNIPLQFIVNPTGSLVVNVTAGI